MDFILSLETSTEVCSAALHEGDKLIITSEVHREQSHASKLAVLADHLLKAADVEIKNLKAVAVAAGPGSYTGLRIGTSLAKGICFSLDIPLISVGTLEVMASQVSVPDFADQYLLCPMIDARRMEVYCQFIDRQGKMVTPVEAKVIDETSFQDVLATGRIIFFGNGAAKCKDVIRHENALFVDDVYPRASALGLLAYKKWKQEIFEDLSGYEPFYLKNFIAKKPKALI